MWQQTIADVYAIPLNKSGELDQKELRSVLQKMHKSYDLIIGTFNVGSNVTGLKLRPGPIAKIMHEVSFR